MSERHIVECEMAVDGEYSVPGCALSEQCGLSCLTLWQTHLRSCENCTKHVEQASECGNVHCERVRIVERLCHLFHDLIEEDKLTLTGSALELQLQRIRMLLEMDAANIFYTFDTDNRKPTSSQIQTQFVFRTLDILFDVKAALTSNLGMKIDNFDLMTLVSHCVQHLKTLGIQK